MQALEHPPPASTELRAAGTRTRCISEHRGQKAGTELQDYRSDGQTEAISLRDEQALQADVLLSMMSIGFMMFMDTSTYTYKRLFLCRLTQYFAVLS